MKTIFLLTLMFLTPNGQDKIYRLVGKWKLEKIEISGKTLFPKTMEYRLKITKTGFTYNLDVNDCATGIASIDDSVIKLIGPSCTKACCDGGRDTLAKHIDYNGKYTLCDSVLIITNAKGKLYLKRIVQIVDPIHHDAKPDINSIMHN